MAQPKCRRRALSPGRRMLCDYIHLSRGDRTAGAERLMQLRDEAQLAGISAEINPGSMLSHAQVMNSLRLWCQSVMPRFK